MRELSSLEKMYFEVTEVFKNLCVKHAELYDLTSDEYTALLENNIEDVERIVASKTQTIDEINAIEAERKNLIGKLNLQLASDDEKRHTIVRSVSDLLKVMSEVSFEKEGKHLMSFNSLLLDIIAKLQEQNKKNQIFLNKAIDSLRTIRENALGIKKCTVYSASGKTTTSTNRLM